MVDAVDISGTRPHAGLARPVPAAPGVSITNTSPLPISTDPMCPSTSTDPSARTTRLRLPGAPAFLPARPNAAVERPFDRIDAVIGSRKRTARVPFLPGKRPAPPEPSRIS